MTQYERRRVIEALAETNAFLEREKRYLPHLQKPDLIASYERHIAKLTGYLETDTMPTVFVRS